jgi:drug/metabolite transporter (DMT)-like permease
VNVARLQALGERNGVALVTAGAVMFSTGPVLISAADASGPVLSFWRLWIGAAVLAVLFLAYGRVTSRWPTRTGWRWAVACGVVFAGHQLCLMVAIKRTSVVDVALMQVLSPVVNAVVAVRLFDEHPGVRFRLWSAVALAGAAGVVLGGSSGPQGEPVGMLLAAANVAFYALYFVWSKQSRDEIDVVPFLFGAILTAAFLVSTYVVVAGAPVGSATGADLLAAAGVAVGPGVIGHFVTTWPLRWVPANVPPLLQLCIPFLAGAMAWVFLGQEITAVHVVGGLVTVAGVAGAIRSPAGRRMIAKEEAVLVAGSS